MTQQEKQLLLKDLCARLPYEVMCSIGLEYPLPLQRIFVDKTDGILLDFYKDGKDYQFYLSEVKPYLRPLSSMTNAERDRMRKDINKTHEDITDWLNKYHFDYRGLIHMGLAIEAPEGMYEIVSTSI